MTRPSPRAAAPFRFSPTILAISALLSLSACSAVKVKLGVRVDLAKVPVASIDAKLPGGPGIAPGQKSPLVVTVTQTDGKVLLTEGKGGGKVMWKDLQVTPTIVTANQKGVIALASDPRISDGKTGSVAIAVPSHPGIKTDLEVPFRYNVAFTANFSGASGSDGFPGTDGASGTNGSDGSTDPNSPSPGGNGSNGFEGGNGGDGGDGGNALPVAVSTTLQSGAQPLIQISVSAKGKQKYFLVDPAGGSLTIKADGGSGGSGGRGGRGGAGGSGGNGTPSGASGMSGSDGRAGSDGSPGRGGLITITLDPSVEQYRSVFHLSSVGGPAPVWNQAAVATLW
jgi:hypothetical protein